MSTSQCAVYQVKDTPEYRDVRFRSYEKLKSEGRTVQIENYQQVYIGRIQPGETPADIKIRLQKQRPKNFKGHSIGCSDVLVITDEGKTTAYYINKDGFIIVPEFLTIKSSSDTRLSIDTTGYEIEGKKGTWLAQDYILMKQKEQLAAQEQKLEELTLKIEDVETLLDDVSDAAYDKAVEVVTDTVRLETHKEDIRLVEESKKWVLSPERKAPKKERDYAAARLDGVIHKIKNVMQTALAKIQQTLMQPEVKRAGKEQIKEKARESIREKLAKGKLDADRKNRERWEREGRIAPTKKKDMEL